LPQAWPGILAVTVLAAGHAAGSAAPVLFTASVYFSRGGLDPSAPVMTLPTHLYHQVQAGAALENAYGTALVLVLGLLAANVGALWLRRERRAP
jgi:phosphate transport system permease protein